MCNVHILHKEIIASKLCSALGSRAPGDSDIFAYGVIIPNFTNSILALEFQILRLCGYTGTGENLIAVSNSCTIVYGYTILENIIISNNSILINETERTYYIIIAQFCFWMDVC